MVRKIPSSETDEPRSIRGSGVRVIGQGKSRRYEVKVLKPDQDNPGGNAYSLGPPKWFQSPKVLV